VGWWVVSKNQRNKLEKHPSHMRIKHEVVVGFVNETSMKEIGE